MSKRQSPAAHVVDFFTNAPYAEAELLYGIVRGIMRKRSAAAAPTATPRKARAKVNAKPAPVVSPAVGEARA